MIRKLVLTVILWTSLAFQCINGFLLVQGPQCYSCDVAFNPETCLETKECLNDQMCYTEKYNNTEQVQAYRLGCISEKVCRQISRHDNSGDCFSCCVDGMCNRNLCAGKTCPHGYYGQFCTDICGYCSGGTQCERLTGQCENGCAGERLPPFCNELPGNCSKPLYGPYCTDECGRCANGENCEKTYGRCLGGCEAGFIPPYCRKACPKPWFGVNCTSLCGHCSGGEVCEHHNGICINGCERGFFPPYCFEDIRVVGEDCSGIKQEHNFTVDGVYLAQNGDNRSDVWCDMVTDNFGWIVFHRRLNDSVNFNRNWVEYKNGFGDRSGSFWWGNDNLATFTSKRNYILRVDMEKSDGQRTFAEYQNFRVESEQEKYRMHLGTYSGNASNTMVDHNNMKFSTTDQDNDNSASHCAQKDQSGWWFMDCAYVNLNGIYGVAAEYGFSWYEGHVYIGLSWAEMKIRSM